MPTHTAAERKKRPGLIDRARGAITRSLTSGFRNRESQEALDRSTVQQPFTGAPGQRARRRALIGKGAPPTPIIKKKKKSFVSTLGTRADQLNKAAGL